MRLTHSCVFKQLCAIRNCTRNLWAKTWRFLTSRNIQSKVCGIFELYSIQIHLINLFSSNLTIFCSCWSPYRLDKLYKGDKFSFDGLDQNFWIRISRKMLFAFFGLGLLCLIYGGKGVTLSFCNFFLILLVFVLSIVICLGVIFFVYSVWCSLSFMDLWAYIPIKFGKISATVFSNTFSVPSSPLSFWHS